MPDSLSDDSAPAGSWPRWLQRAAAWGERYEGFAIVLVFVACFHSPVLRCPFIGDDIHNSNIAGVLELRGCSLRDVARERFNDDLENGRLAPLGSWGAPYAWRLLSDVGLHKALVLALVLGNMALLYALLCGWGFHHTLAQLGLFGLALSLQMRLRDDPILAYDGLMQWLANFLIGSLLCLERYLRFRRWPWLAASCAMYAVSVLADGTGYAFLLVYAAAALARDRAWRPALRTLVPYLGVTAAMLVAFIALRDWTHGFGDPVCGLHWSFPKIFLTTFWQAVSAAPLSFITLCGVEHRDIYQPAQWLNHWQNWLTLLGAGVLCFFLLRRLGEDASARVRPPRSALLVGASLWIGPGLLLAPLPEYQNLTRPGLGYPVEYLQSFGLAMLFVCFLQWAAGALERHWRTFRAVVALAAAAVALITFDVNRAVVEHWRMMTDFAMRSTVEAAFDAGLGEDVPKDATLLLTTWRAWLDLERPERSAAFYAKCLGYKAHVVNATPGLGAVSANRDLAGLPKPVFALCEQSLNEHSSYVILVRVEDRADEPRSPESAALGRESHEDLGSRPPVTRNFRVFIRDTVLNPDFFAVPNQLFGHRPGANYGARDHQGEILDVATMRLVRRGRDWAIYEGEFAGPVDVATLGMAGHPVLAEIHSARVATRRLTARRIVSHR